MKRVFLSVLLSIVSVSFASTLEERVKKLEEKVKILEERLNKLEGKKPPSVKEIKETKSHSVEIKNPVSYRVIKKKFEKASLKESLWKKTDQIILKMVFKNNLPEPVSAIKGKVVIFDKKGRKLMETDVNINKALNFFRGTDIKPGEELKYDVFFEYDNKNPNHRYVKNASLKELSIKFIPTLIEFPDGRVKYFEEK